MHMRVSVIVLPFRAASGYTSLQCGVFPPQYSLFSSEPTTILKHCTTRWLSLLRSVNHFIDQFGDLKSYFLSCDEAETVKVKIIIDTLHNPLTRPIVQFLSYIFPSKVKFNKVFRKSKKKTTCRLFQEMSSSDQPS